MTAVLVVEDDAGFREALLVGLAQLGFSDLRACVSGSEALAAAAARRPDIVLMDIGLPDMSGIEATRALRAAHPALPVILWTVFEDPALLFAALAAGGAGYLLKGAGLEELARAIDDARAGRAPLSSTMTPYLIESWRQGQAPAACPLTERELEVLELLAGGHSYADAAAALGIRLGTVQGYVKTIYRKLEVATKAEAAVVALRHGWLRLGECPPP